jgi:23S rRNA (pseudouridine1915-N3)-methyltransferase
MITILCVSDSDKHFALACEEYIKRLGKNVNIINLKPSNKDTIPQIIKHDTQSIINKINSNIIKNNQIILLSKEGENRSTEQWQKYIAKHTNQSHDMCFVIGGPYWLDEQLIPYHERLSFAAITMPHGLAKLVLLEQIYRCKQITEGRNYHY